MFAILPFETYDVQNDESMYFHRRKRGIVVPPFIEKSSLVNLFQSLKKNTVKRIYCNEIRNNKCFTKRNEKIDNHKKENLRIKKQGFSFSKNYFFLDFLAIEQIFYIKRSQTIILESYMKNIKIKKLFFS